MSYVIKDIEKGWWLLVERFLNNQGDIITGVEPVTSFRAASTFTTIDDCKEIVDIIRNESDYELGAYATENVEDLKKAEKNKELEAQKKIDEYARKKMDEVIAEGKAKGLSNEEIAEQLAEGFQITKEEFEQIIKGD